MEFVDLVKFMNKLVKKFFKERKIMGLFSKPEKLDNIEWVGAEADSNEVVVWKHEKEEVSTNSFIIVKHNQMAVLAEQGGKALQVFGPGRHEIATEIDTGKWFNKQVMKHIDGENIYRCQIYFINKIVMTELMWGTPNPIPFALDVMDGAKIELHLRANGYFGLHIGESTDLINNFLSRTVGTSGYYTKQELITKLKGELIKNVTTLLGKTINEQGADIFNLAAHYNALSDSIKEQMIPVYESFGISLDLFAFNSIDIPQEDKARLNELRTEDLEAAFAKRKRLREAEANAAAMDLESAAMARKREREGYTYQQEHSIEAMKIAAANEGMAGTIMGAGMGLGMGGVMGGMMGAGMAGVAQNAMGQMTQQAQAPQAQPAAQQEATEKCPKCGAVVAAGAKFCANCGEKMGNFCPDCGAPVNPGAKFCGNCGKKLTNNCTNCGAELAPGAKFCPECGTKQ